MEVPQEIQILINSLLQEIEQLKRQITVLEEKLSGYEHPKNSGNSSKPPSQDPFHVRGGKSGLHQNGDDITQVWHKKG